MINNGEYIIDVEIHDTWDKKNCHHYVQSSLRPSPSSVVERLTMHTLSSKVEGAIYPVMLLKG